MSARSRARSTKAVAAPDLHTDARVMAQTRARLRPLVFLLVAGAAALTGWMTTHARNAESQSDGEFNDSHFHLTNYVQKGTTLRDFLEDHGRRRSAGRRCSGSRCSRPGRTRTRVTLRRRYYLQTDAPLYYYSFTDAAHRDGVPARLKPSEQARFDPMITGFNPADMYAVDHIRRVLHDVPGRLHGHRRVHHPQGVRVVEGRGRTASLTDPALDRILEFAAEVGLVVILHNDIDMPFAKPDQEPVYLAQMQALLQTASEDDDHLGAHRSRPHRSSGAGRRRGPSDPGPAGSSWKPWSTIPQLRHVYFDISWDEVAKYAVRRRRPSRA